LVVSVEIVFMSTSLFARILYIREFLSLKSHRRFFFLDLIAGENVTAAVTAQPLMQQHAKEDGQDQSYQSGPSVEVVRDELEIITSSLLRTDVVKFLNGTELQLFPSSELIHKQVNETRRRLGDFQQCSPCTCCDRTRSWCIPTACCYNIRCNLQGLPFGLCSFVPISCTCYGCTS
jgi:hypothetical protein